VLYILHGDEEFRRTAAIKELKRKLGDPALVDMNTTFLDGRKLQFGELAEACKAIPFMLPARLVIVRGLLERVEQGNRELREALLDYIPKLPPTTWLVLEEERTIGEDNPILAEARKLEKAGKAKVLTFERLKGEKLNAWIRERAEEKGIEITLEAVEELAAFVGDELRILDSELDKLAAYVNGQRPVTRDDVHALVSYIREASIFSMVDAMGRKDAKSALDVLHRLLDQGEHPLAILGMVVRQIRIMILVKALLKRGYSAKQIARRLRLHTFVVEKAIRQASSFSTRQLKAIYQRLLELDVEMKTGRTEGSVALELLVTALSARPKGR